MPVKKSAKRSSRSSVLSPLDVRSSSTLKEMEKRIRKGPVTIILVYADWCGHCHQIMPHWDKATQSPDRSVQAVKVNETMLSNVNSMVNQSINQQAPPINVSGYPSIILVDNQGNKVSDVNPVKDTAVLSKAMKQVGPIVEEGQARNNQPVNKPEFPSIVMNSANNKRNVKEEEEPNMLPPSPSMVPSEDSMGSPSLYAENPPTARNLKKGGSLYASLSQTAYTLAPAATLFGIASLMWKRDRKSKKGRKSQKGGAKRASRRIRKSQKTRKTRK